MCSIQNSEWSLYSPLCPVVCMQWLVTSSPPDPSGGHVTLGLLLDTDHAFSILDMGPPADSSEVS